MVARPASPMRGGGEWAAAAVGVAGAGEAMPSRGAVRWGRGCSGGGGGGEVGGATEWTRDWGRGEGDRNIRNMPWGFG